MLRSIFCSLPTAYPLVCGTKISYSKDPQVCLPYCLPAA